MAADVQKFVDAATGTPFAHNANVLEAKVLLVRVANWRTLATRDAKGFATFKTNVGKAQEQVASLEKLDLPPELAKQLALVKSGIAKYAEAFDKTGPNLVKGDDLYYHSITPVIASAIEQMDKVKEAIDEAFKKTTAETGDRIDFHHHDPGNGRRPCRAARPCHRLPDRARHHPSAVRSHRRHEGTRRRQFRRDAAGARSQGRGRRHGAGGRDLQGQGRGKGARRSRDQDQAGRGAGAPAQGRDGQDGR